MSGFKKGIRKVEKGEFFDGSDIGTLSYHHDTTGMVKLIGIITRMAFAQKNVDRHKSWRAKR